MPSKKQHRKYIFQQTAEILEEYVKQEYLSCKTEDLNDFPWGNFNILTEFKRLIK
jgi:hypothetical protein